MCTPKLKFAVCVFFLFQMWWNFVKQHTLSGCWVCVSMHWHGLTAKCLARQRSFIIHTQLLICTHHLFWMSWKIFCLWVLQAFDVFVCVQSKSTCSLTWLPGISAWWLCVTFMVHDKQFLSDTCMADRYYHVIPDMIDALEFCTMNFSFSVICSWAWPVAGLPCCLVYTVKAVIQKFPLLSLPVWPSTIPSGAVDKISQFLMVLFPRFWWKMW